jgi:hypothetical protein
MREEFVLLITWNVAHSSPTVLSFGKKCRFHRLSLVIGVVNLSLGKTQASGVVLMEVARHSPMDLIRPSDKAASRAPRWLLGNPGQDERDSGMIPNGVPG